MSTDYFKPKSGLFKSEMENNPMLQQIMNNEDLQLLITNFGDLVITKEDLKFRACVKKDQSSLKKFVNFFKWIGKNICYYIGSFDLKRMGNFVVAFSKKHPGKLSEEKSNLVVTMTGWLRDGIKVPLGNIAKLVSLSQSFIEIKRTSDSCKFDFIKNKILVPINGVEYEFVNFEFFDDDVAQDFNIFFTELQIR